MGFGGECAPCSKTEPIFNSCPNHRLDLASSDIAFTRMRAAIDHLHFDPKQLAESTTQDQETILLGTHVRDLLLKRIDGPRTTPSLNEDPLPFIAGPPEETSNILLNDQRLQSWAKRYQRSNPITMDGDPSLDLNSVQIAAVANMLGNRLSLVQGVGLKSSASCLVLIWYVQLATRNGKE